MLNLYPDPREGRGCAPKTRTIEAQRILTGLLDDESERARYVDMLCRMSMNPVSAIRLARRAGLMHRLDEVRPALLAGPRYRKLPTPGIERLVLRDEYRHATHLRGLAA